MRQLLLQKRRVLRRRITLRKNQLMQLARGHTDNLKQKLCNHRFRWRVTSMLTVVDAKVGYGRVD